MNYNLHHRTIRLMLLLMLLFMGRAWSETPLMASSEPEALVQTLSEAPAHTASFYVNGVLVSSLSYDEGNDIVFPSDPDPLNEKSFVGWSSSEIDGTTDVAPSFVSSGVMGDGDVSFYAVFASVTDDYEMRSLVIDTSTKNIPTSYETANRFIEHTLNGVRFKIQQMYVNGDYLQWRAKDNSNGTGAMYNVEALSFIQSVVLIYNEFDTDYNFSLRVGTSENPSSGTKITPSFNGATYTFDCSGGDYSYFVLTNGSGAGYLSSVTINYRVGSQSISGYCTASDVREEAGIGFPFASRDASMAVGPTYQQTLTNPHGLDVSYGSSDESVATVAEDGTVTLLRAGVVTITAAFSGNDSYLPAEASYSLTVLSSKFPSGIEYEETSTSRTITSGTYTHTLTNPHGLTVAYSSSDEDVATIDGTTGEVTLLSVGETTITATFTEDENYGGTVTSYTLNVIKDNPELSFERSVVNVGLADSRFLQAVTTAPANLPIAYSSSNEGVATIDGTTGEVTLLSVGETTITALFEGNDMYNSASTTYTLNVSDDYASLPFSFNLGKDKIASTTGLSQTGLGEDYGTRHSKLRFDTQGDCLVLKFTGMPRVLSFNICGLSFSGGTFKVQYSTNGVSYTDAAAYTDLGEEETKYLKNIPLTARYVKWVYATKGSGNVGLGNIRLTQSETVSIGTTGYTTYVTQSEVSFPTGLMAYVVTHVDEERIYLEEVDDAADGVALILKADAPGTYAFESDYEGVSDATTNLLQASDGSTVGDGSTIYALAKKNNVVGFYPVAEGLTIPAGKAYLTIADGQGVKDFLNFDFSHPSGMAEVKGQTGPRNNLIFNLAGQRLSRMQKGINIVNGKRVLAPF